MEKRNIDCEVVLWLFIFVSFGEINVKIFLKICGIDIFILVGWYILICGRKFFIFNYYI